MDTQSPPLTGTDDEALSGAFTLSHTNWPRGARQRLARAQNVAAHRANLVREAAEGDDLGARLTAQAGFEEAIAGYRAAMLDLFDMEDPRHTTRA